MGPQDVWLSEWKLESERCRNDCVNLREWWCQEDGGCIMERQGEFRTDIGECAVQYADELRVYCHTVIMLSVFLQREESMCLVRGLNLSTYGLLVCIYLALH